ncbi:hypothetical protein CLHUN_25560 [Ruminiclostridium hungatei]|uniref:Uncharacterized protein n=1 Tax=Ruminiclostridium hungatei TaxID=48256 RepID=A0A1V4SK48_RUMHU|nr:DUF4173 domain-containing protein [Ruminiclostridium hungatei]OPX43617.1 hypothetical protein CLHUN_25560 [Ruminiclostridium hungatei]
MEDQKNPQHEDLTKQTPDNRENNPALTSVSPGVTYYSPYIPRDKTPEYQAFKARVISSKGVTITVLSILLAILFTETIFLGAAGISVPVFALAFYSSLFYYFKESGKPFNRPAIYLTFPVFLLAFSFFLHYNPSTQFITWLTLISLVCIQLVMLGNNPGEKLFSFDMLLKVLANVIGRPFTNLAMPFISLEYLRGKKSKTSKNAILIFIGLAVSLPVALILLGLFMSADAVFENAVNSLIDYMGVDFGNTFADIFVGFFGGILLSAALLGLKYEELKKKPAGTVGNCLDSLVVGTFLTIINILLIAFVGFQFAYLFGGTSNINLTNMTYAEYARRGFFELTAASGLIFSIALFVTVMTKKKDSRLPLWVKLCTVSLCLCNGVLLVSGMKRMLLYVDVYGLSVKRVLTLWFMCIIGLCLVWMMIKCFIPSVDVIKLIGITVVAGVCILSLTNTERIIARYNIDRYISSPDAITLDIYHLGGLSYTTTPEIARLKSLESKDGQYTRRDIVDILYKQKQAYNSRNLIYGFTLDSIQAQKIFSEK